VTKPKPPAKAAKKATKAPTTKLVGRTTAARTAKAAATRTAKKAGSRQPPPRGDTPPPAAQAPAPRLWVLGAYVACEQLGELGATRWDDSSAAAARLLVMRADGLAAEPTDETMRGPRARPTSFVNWKAAAAKYRELAVDIPHAHLRKASGKGPFSGMVSPYALRIALAPGHELYDRRGLLRPTPEMLASVDQVGVLDRVKFKTMREAGRDIDYVDDGRQRINAVRAVNLTRLRRWWQEVSASGRASAPPPLIAEVAVDEIVGLREALRLSAVLNAPALRRDDTLQDQAARAAQLRAQNYSRDEIAVQLGVSAGTVSNLLSLQQLAPALLEAMWSGSLPPGVAYLLAKEDVDHQADLWTWVQRVPSGQRLGHLRDILVAEGRVHELQVLVDAGSLSADAAAADKRALAQAKERLEQLKAGGGKTARPLAAKEVQKARKLLETTVGRGPAVLRAALDFTLGVLDFEQLLEAVAQADDKVDPLLVECPECCAEPGHKCMDDEEEPVEPCCTRRHEIAQRLRKAEAA